MGRGGVERGIALEPAPALLNHRIIQVGINKSNDFLGTAKATMDCVQVPHPHISWTLPGMKTPPLSWVAVLGLENLFQEGISNLNTAPFEAISSHSVTHNLGEESDLTWLQPFQSPLGILSPLPCF